MAITVNTLTFITRSNGDDGRIFARANMTISATASNPLSGTLVDSSGSGSATQLPQGFVVTRCDLVPGALATASLLPVSLFSGVLAVGTVVTLPIQVLFDQENQQLAWLSQLVGVGTGLAVQTFPAVLTSLNFLVEAVKLT